MSNVVWISSETGWPPRGRTLGRGDRSLADAQLQSGDLDNRAFETRLDRMFGQSPPLSDNDAFAARIEQRLRRGWTFRRLLIGGLGVLGGVIGVAQMASSGVVGHVEGLSAQTNRLWSTDLHRITALHLPLPVAPFGGGVLWMAAFVAVVGLGFAITRVIEDL